MSFSSGDSSDRSVALTSLSPARTHAEHHRKTETATWLSPIPQPRVDPAHPKIIPSDCTFRKYIREAATSIDSLVEENISYFGESPQDGLRSYPFTPTLSKDSSVDSNTLSRSVSHAPVEVTWEIAPECATPGVQRDPNTNVMRAGTLQYHWLEHGSLLRDGEKFHEGVYTFQIRHHTKLEPFHEWRRPVYCVNLKSDEGDFLDLRLIMLINVELPFLTQASTHFSKAGDLNGGKPITDHRGRTYIDERIIRRAAFRYSEFQRSRLEEESGLIPEALFSKELAFAHFLIFRSHLPELQIQAKDPVEVSTTLREVAA